MNENTYVFLTLMLMSLTFLAHIISRKFDPFAPIWLFFVGYAQLYVIQPLSYHEWAVTIRGLDVVSTANFRATWALAWFVIVYHFGPGRAMSRLLPNPPQSWSIGLVQLVSPVLVLWGLVCAGIVLKGLDDSGSPEESLFLSFKMVMLVAGGLLIITGRQPSRPRPGLVAAGIAVVLAYLVIWMYNGKRSHSLVAILVGVCVFYIPRLRRPSFPVLIATALAGLMAVGISIGWRFYSYKHGTQGSFSEFVEFVSTFDLSTTLEAINLDSGEAKVGDFVSHETEEWGGLLLMIDTVPERSEYDYGENYLRIFSTFIPRVIWPEKPLFGRSKWVSAWIAGSELKRDETFIGPSIGILGACQLNGGAWATLIVMGCAALLLRAAYEFFRRHASVPWVQIFWALTYYNAWVMTAGNDPLTWFYYNYSFTTMPPLFLFWAFNKVFARPGWTEAKPPMNHQG